MRRVKLALLAIGLLAGMGADLAIAAGRHRYYGHAANQPQYSSSAAANGPQARSYSRSGPVVWPYSPNYGNAVGAAYSPAAGMRQGQFFGTFGLRPADARARGAY